MCEDINSHNSSKGSNSRDVSGLVAEEHMDDDCLMCINNEEGAGNNMQNTDSAQDLTFVSIAIAGGST